MELLESDVCEPDPAMVDFLSKAVWEALQENIIINETSHADVLSAVFSVLRRVLVAAKDSTELGFEEVNAREVGRVLGGLLLEFGAETCQ